MPNLTQSDGQGSHEREGREPDQLLNTADLSSGLLWRPAASLRNRRVGAADAETGGRTRAAS